MRAFAFMVKFSYRNLWRSPMRTVIMLMSLSVGSAFIIWDLNFANSGSKEMMTEFLSQYAGNYHITNADYYGIKNRKEFNNYKTLSDSDVSDKTLFDKSTQRVTAPVFISGEKKTLGALLTGLEVERELELSTLSKSVKVGRFLDANGEREIVLGRKFAERINVKLGDEVAVVGQALDGSIANDLLKIVGLLDFGGGDLEESLALTQIKTARELMVLSDDQYHQRVSFDFSEKSIPELQAPATASKWSEILPEIGVSVKFIDNFTWLVSVIIVLVVSLGLSNTLMITFLEREQEFQSLNIIGARSRWITTALMIEVFIMGTLALMVAIALGHAATMYCHYHPIDIQMFTGGKPIIMGGMVIQPLVRLHPVYKYYWQVPLMIYFFLGVTMLYPLIRVIRRSQNAI
jgi:ABC-type lipoprotein release transport system permease subunit